MTSRRIGVVILAALAAAGGAFGLGYATHDSSHAVTTLRTVQQTVAVDRDRAVYPGAAGPRGPVSFTSIDDADLAALVPADASPTSEWRLTGGKGFADQLAVTWTRRFSYYDAQHGLVVWQRMAHEWRDSWKPVYSLVTGTRTPYEVDELSASSGDVTGDGHPDLLVAARTDGTGMCGTFRLLATSRTRGVTTLFRTFACGDRTWLELTRGGLLIETGIDKDPRTRGQIHCCYLRERLTFLRWRDGKLIRTVSVKPNTVNP